MSELNDTTCSSSYGRNEKFDEQITQLHNANSKWRMEAQVTRPNPYMEKSRNKLHNKFSEAFISGQTRIPQFLLTDNSRMAQATLLLIDRT